MAAQSSSTDPVQPDSDESFATEYEVFRRAVEGFVEQMKDFWDLELPPYFKAAKDEDERKDFFFKMVPWATKMFEEKLEGNTKAQYAQAMFGVIQQRGREILNKYCQLKIWVPESSGATEDEEQAA